jgi:hypothetical protein
MSSQTFAPGPTPKTVRTAGGDVLIVPGVEDYAEQ